MSVHDGPHEFVVRAFPSHDGAWLLVECRHGLVGVTDCPEMEKDDEISVSEINDWIEINNLPATSPAPDTALAVLRELVAWNWAPGMSGNAGSELWERARQLVAGQTEETP